MKLNKKGYMLVEIVLASALAFGIAYFILDLTIKLKNKNDDLLVETLVNTDKTIIANALMRHAIEEGENFDCNKISINDNVIAYDTDKIDIVSNYMDEIPANKVVCSKDSGIIHIKIPISVKQIKDKNFDVEFDYRY